MKMHYLPLLFKEGWRTAPGWFDYRSRPPRPFGPPPLGRGGIKMHSAGVVGFSPLLCKEGWRVAPGWFFHDRA